MGTTARREGETGEAREWVLACVDASAYANSVCDHAGWFASDPDVGVDVLHVEEAGPDRSASDRLVEHGVARLRDAGVGPLAGRTERGSFVDAVIRSHADIVVMGRRGTDSGAERQTLGSNVDAAVRKCAKPICLAPKVFMPMHRALVLLDADMSHRTALEFVLGDFRLSALPMDVAVVGEPSPSSDAKVAWAREMLAKVAANVFAISSEGLDDAVVQYTQSRAADLIVLSRAVITPDPQAPLHRIEDAGLWSTRTPVLIC